MLRPSWSGWRVPISFVITSTRAGWISSGALSNKSLAIHRHSGSKTADIRMFVDAECLHVEVSDRGKGIPPERLAEIRSGGSGVGIRGMQERLRQFGGEMTIDSTRSDTRVLALVPIPKDVKPTDDESAHIASGMSELKLVKQS